MALLVALTFTVYATSPVVTNGDSFLVAPTAHSLIHEHDLDIDEHLGPGTDGGLAYLRSSEPTGSLDLQGIELPRELPDGWHAFDKFSWVTAVVVAPLALLFELPGLVGLERFDIDQTVTAGDTGLFNLLGSSLLTCVAVLALASTAWAALPILGRRRAAFVVGVVVALGTPAWSTLSRGLWNQTATVMFLSLAVLVAVRLAKEDEGHESRRRRRLLAMALGVTVGLSYATRPTSITAVLCIGVWLLATKRSVIGAYIAGGAVVALPWITVNLLTYGTLQPPYFSTERIGLRPETLQAIAANLVSPSRGLLVYTSVSVLAVIGGVLAIRRRTAVLPRGLAITAVAVIAIHLVVVSGAGEDWWAGASYGPRFMADSIPFLLLLSLPAVELVQRAPRRSMVRLLTGALIAASVAMHLPGGWSKPAHCWSLDPVNINVEPARVWDWKDAQSLRPLGVLVETGSARDAMFRRCDEFLARRAPEA